MRNILSAFAGLVLLAASACTPAYANDANITAFGVPQAYTPSLAGQTDQPGVTYTTDAGYFYTIGNMSYVNFNIVTSGTTTKTTLTDNFAVTLPIAAATVTGTYQSLACYVQNATAVTTGVLGEIASGASQVTFRTVPSAAATSVITWASTSPGIGGLTTVITAKCSGWYQTSTN